MEVRNARTFARIAEVKSFTRVAEELGYTQSAVTMQVKQLERELGCTLFERLGRTVRLTPQGERLVPIAQRMLQASEEAAHIAQKPDEVQGSLRIGAIDSMLVSDLPTVLVELTRTYPNVRISTHQGTLDDEFTMLKRNDIDVLLFLDRQIYSPEWIRAFELPGKAGFFAGAQSPLAKRHRISLKEILAQPLYLTERNISYRTALEQLVNSKGQVLTPRIECGSTETLVQLCMQTGGITYLPERACAAALRSGELVALDVALPQLDLWYQLVYHKNKVVSPQMELFIDLVRKQLGGTGRKAPECAFQKGRQSTAEHEPAECE